MSKRTSLSLKIFVSLTFLLLVGTAILAACGSSSGTATASSSSSTSSSSTTTQPSGPGGGGGSNARSGPASGGASGTVSNVSTSGFTLTTSAGQKVTVDEASSTTYQNGTISISASAITNGESVLVLGTVNTTNGTTIAATQVIVQPTSRQRRGYISSDGSQTARGTHHGGSARVVSAPGRMPGVEERGRRIVRERPDRPLPLITGAPRGIAVRANRRFQGTLLMSFYHQ